MEEFNIKSIAALLTEAMRIKNFSVEKLSQTTGISDRFIELLLDEKFEKLPPAPYVRGYMFKIGDALNLDGEELWEIIKIHHAHTVAQSGKKDALPHNRFLVQPLNIKLIVGAIIALVFVSIILFRIPSLFGKPKLELVDFENDMRVTTSTFIIRGTIDPKNELFINDEQIVANESGVFEKQVELTPDFNTFRFSVKGLLGGTLEETRQVFYEEPKDLKKKGANTTSTESTDSTE